MVAQQLEGEPDLVTEVDPVRGPQKSLVCLVRRCQLRLARGLLGEGRVIGSGR